MNSTHYTFGKTFRGIPYHMETLYKPLINFLLWEVPSKKYMNLFYNEMQGQISDGMWENSRGTEWLRRNPIIFIQSDRCVLHIYGYINPGRKSFPIKGFLEYDWFLERLPEEAGTETFAEAKAIWDEMAVAIRNVGDATELGLGSALTEWLSAFLTDIRKGQVEKIEAYFEEVRQSGYAVDAQSPSFKCECKGLSCWITVDPDRLMSIPKDRSALRAARALRFSGKPGYFSLNNLPEVVSLTHQILNLTGTKLSD